MQDDDALALYRFAFEETKRLLDLQLSAIRDHLTRAGSLTKEGMATLAVGLGVLGLFLNVGLHVDRGGAGALVVAYLLTLVSVVASIRIHSGNAYRLTFGPNPRGLVDVVGRPGMSERRLIMALLHLLPVKVAENDRVLLALSRDHVWATRILLVGIVLHLLALAYIIGGTMFA